MQREREREKERKEEREKKRGDIERIIVEKRDPTRESRFNSRERE